MKRVSLCLMIVSLAFSCTKEKVENNTPFIGSWIIEGIDSVWFYRTAGEFRFYGQIKGSGTVVFKPDNRGTLHCDRAGLANFQTDFIWDYDSINKIIDYSFKNGTTIGIVTQLSDTMMSMYYRYYLGFPDWESRWYYKLTLKKQAPL